MAKIAPRAMSIVDPHNDPQMETIRLNSMKFFWVIVWFF